MGSGGGSSGRTDNSFSRHGGGTTSLSRGLPAYLSDLIKSNAQESPVGSELAGNQNSFLSGLLTRDQTAVPGKSVIDSTLGIDPNNFPGHDTLAALADRNPYSDQYANETSQRFDDTTKQAVAASQTGGERVRGGQAHSAMVEGDATNRAALDRFREVSGVQRQDADIQARASQIFNSITTAKQALTLGAQSNWAGQFLQMVSQGLDASKGVDQRRGVNAANLAMAGEMQGTRDTTTTEDTEGAGTQTNVQGGWHSGLDCCFIFLEVLNGKLPWYVRRARDMFVTKQRRDGYMWMSQWLVPLMRRFSFVKHFVNWVLVKPLSAWGAWYFGEKPLNSSARFLKPYVFGWFKLWNVIGGL